MKKAEYVIINKPDVSAQLLNYVETDARDLCQYFTKPFQIYVDKYGTVKIITSGYLIFDGDTVSLRSMSTALRHLM